MSKARLKFRIGAGIVAAGVCGLALQMPGDGARAQETAAQQPIEARIDALAAPPDAAACRAASRRLAETDGRDEEASAIALSEECNALRQANAFDVREDMAAMIAQLEREGIEFEDRLYERLLACAPQVDAQLAAAREAEAAEAEADDDDAAAAESAEAGEEAMPGPEPELTPAQQQQRTEMIEACEANTRMALYAEGIATLNRSRAERAAIEHADYEAQLERLAQEAAEAEAIYQQKVEADRAAHEAAMADWRRRVALCEEGKREYCAKKED